jgi:hypothetical protein
MNIVGTYVSNRVELNSAKAMSTDRRYKPALASLSGAGGRRVAPPSPAEDASSSAPLRTWLVHTWERSMSGLTSAKSIGYSSVQWQEPRRRRVSRAFRAGGCSRIVDVCHGETLEKRSGLYLVEVVSRRDDAFPRRCTEEPSMTTTFRPMSRATNLRNHRAARFAVRAAQAWAALTAAFATRGAEERYLSQATDLPDLELRLRYAERGQAPYQRSLTFHTYS